jgi:hypothetical protein
MVQAQLATEKDISGPPPRIWPAAPELLQWLMGNRLQQAICVAAKLGIADLVKDGPKEIGELARTTESHAPSLYRLMRVLAERGIFVETEPGLFATTRHAALLQSDRPDSLRPVALWFGSVAYKVFGDLEYSVRTGQPSFDRIFGMEFFRYLQQNPDVGVLFNQVMIRQTAEVASSLPTAYDFSEIETLVDVGGGHGHLIAAILKAYPKMRGVLFDRPHVIAGINGLLDAAGVANRCEMKSGDISQLVPSGGDAYLLKSIVHGASDELAIKWLRNCYDAMNRKGKLLLVEYIIPPGNQSHPGKLMDLLMLVGTHGGHERTESEFRTLLAKAGFDLVRIVATKTSYSVIEGRPVN